MPGLYEVRSTARLEAVGRALKEAGDEGKGLKRELSKGIREGTKPTVAAIRRNALQQLPQRGGLAERVASSQLGARTTTTGRNIGVRITGRGKSVRNLQAIDQGTVRHPVYGTKAWVAQRVTPGFWTQAIEQDARRLRGVVSGVIRDVAKKLEG